MELWNYEFHNTELRIMTTFFSLVSGQIYIHYCLYWHDIKFNNECRASKHRGLQALAISEIDELRGLRTKEAIE